MNEEQARVTAAALNLAMRVRLGQFGEIVEQCMEWEPDKTDEWCERREKAEAILLQARDIIMPDLRDMHSLAGGYGVYAKEGTERLYNVLLAVRSCLAYHNKPEGGYTVDFRKPMTIYVNEDLPKCEVVANDNKNEIQG
jgi:hypothetical protein